MAKSITSQKIALARARASFLVLDKPRSFQEGQTARFQATALLDPTNEAHAKLIAQVKAEASALCAQAGLDPSQLDGVCFGNADKHPKKSKYDGYKGMFYVALSNEARPGVANRAGRPVAEGDPQWPYSGCYANFKFTLWLQNNRFGKKINGNLIAIQFVEDGPAFGRGPVNVEDEFEPLPETSPAVGQPNKSAPVAAGSWD